MSDILTNPHGTPPSNTHSADTPPSKVLLQSTASKPCLDGLFKSTLFGPFVVTLPLVDILILLSSGYLTNEACRYFGIYAPAGEQVLATLAATLCAAVVLHYSHAYASDRLGDVHHRLRVLIKALALGGATAYGCFLLMPLSSPATAPWPLIWLMLAAGLITATTVVSASAARSSSNAARMSRRVIVVGANDYGRNFVSRLTRDTTGTTTFLGLYDDEPDGSPAGHSDYVLGNLEDLIDRSRWERIDSIVLALPLSDLNKITRSRLLLGRVAADIYVAAEVLDLTCKFGRVDRVGGNPVIKIESRPLNEWQRFQKGLIDWILASIILVAALPVLMLVALAVRLDSPGPAMFRQPRLGLNNREFVMLKFRTMYNHMADLKSDRQTIRDDPRITRVGRVLRKTSLDELPQLINVLRGEMSLVGPRPHAPNTKAGNEFFHDAVADYARRHRVKPGITGWAQVNGWRGETRTRYQLEQRVAHDLYYIDNWSLKLDFKIILLTALRELNSKVAF